MDRRLNCRKMQTIEALKWAIRCYGRLKTVGEAGTQYSAPPNGAILRHVITQAISRII